MELEANLDLSTNPGVNLMNKKFLLAASMVLACACQPKQPMQQNMQDDSKKQEQKPSGGCCEMQKPQTAPLSEAAKTPAGPVTAVTPEVKVEHKAP